MSGPWEKYATADSQEGPWAKYQASSPPAEAQAQETDDGGFGLGRGAGLVARGVVNAVAGLPLMAMDAGVALRNISESAAQKLFPGATAKIYEINQRLAGKSDLLAAILPQGPGQYESPTSMFDSALTDAGLPEPKGVVEKGGSLLVSAVAGSKIPAPTINNPAPKGFVAPAKNAVRDATLAAARKEGYVVPPATTNPSLLNRTLEGAAGKITTAQLAAMKNQDATNALARRAVGLSNDVPITPETLTGLRASAGKVYEQIGNAGDIVADSQYLDDLAALGNSVDEIAKSFPEANVGASKEIGKLVDSMLQDKFSSKSALEYVKQLRNQAKLNLSPLAAADPSKQALGMAQREAAGALEDMIMRHLVANGDEEVAQMFGQARKLIAVSHTIENALNESTGNVKATELAGQLKRGKPLSGELEIAAKFAQAFPKAAREVTESMPGISPLDFYASGGASALTGNLLPMLYPAARMAIRHALLTGPGQKLATESAKAATRTTIGLIPSAAIQATQEVSR